MTPKTPVAAERRMDLASLFCMIGRHGPAVALAVMAMVSVLAGFIIYRTVRGKRRKARAEAADGDSCGGGGGGGGAAEADASAESSAEETRRFAGSTDESDEVASGVFNEDPDLIQSHLKVRQRRAAAAAAAAAAEKKAPKRDKVPDNMHSTSDDKEETAAVWDINSHKATEMYAEEVSRRLLSDMYTVAEMKLEDAVDCQRCDTDKTTEDVMEEECGNKSCTKEPELINDESFREEEEVEEEEKAKLPEDDFVTTDQDDSDKKTRWDEETPQFALNNQVCFEQTPHVSENVGNDRRESDANKAEANSLESNLEEAVNHSADVTVPFMSYQEGNFLLCGIDYNSYTSNGHLSPGEEKENEGRDAEEECVHHQQSAQQTEIESSTFEQDASLHSDQHNHDIVLPVSPSGIATDATTEIQGITDFRDLSSNDQKADEMSPTLDPDHDALRPPTPSRKTESQPEKDVEQEVQMINNDTYSASFPPSHDTEIQSSTFEQETPSQHEQCEHEHETLDKDTDHDVLFHPVPSHETQSQSEKGENETSVDQPVVQMIKSDAFEASVTAADDTVACHDENVLTAEEICHPHEGMEAEERVDHQQTEIQSSTNVVLQADGSLVNEAVKEDADRSHFNDGTVDERQKDNDFLNSENDCILSEAADQVKRKSCSVVEGCESAGLNPAMVCLNEPTDLIKVDNDSLSGIPTDAKAEIPGITGFPDVASNGQQSQREQKEDETSPTLDKDTNHDALCPPMASESQSEKDKNGTSEDQQGNRMINIDDSQPLVAAARDAVARDGENTSMAEELSQPNVLPCCEETRSSEATHIEAFDSDRPDAFDAFEMASGTVEEISFPHLLSVCRDQQSDHMVNIEASVADLITCDDFTAPITIEEMSLPDMSSSCQDHQHAHFEALAGAASVFSHNFLPFNQSELKGNDKDSISSPGVGKESGISSMAVSPDLQEDSHDIAMTVESMTLPEIECDFQVISCHKPEEQSEAPFSLFADNVAVSAMKQDTVEPYSCCLFQQTQSEHANLAYYESLAANEDIFGHEVEDGYHKALDQFMVQITGNITSITDELKRQTEENIVVEVVQVREKKEEACNVKQKEMEAEKEKDEDYEKTEISIMEATMDNNEWITDSNYQVLPWMNIAVPSFSQSYTKTDQNPPEDSTAATDATCIDTADIPPLVEQASTLSTAEENTENTKKVVAVQPMPQTVNVTFRVHYLNHSPCQTVAVTGNQQELGSWKGFIPLERAKDGYWSCVVSLPAESHVEWKFVVLDKGEVCRWEECGNRLLDTGFGDDLLVHKWWGFL